MPKPFPLLSLALALAAACRPPEPAAAEPPMVLETYAVPPGVARGLGSTLSTLLTVGSKEAERRLGRTSLTPDGRLLVLAPASIQKGVAQLIEQIRAHPAEGPATVEMTYWLVLGTRGPPEVGEGLEEVKPALAEIQRSQGDMRFKLWEKLNVSSLSGEDGRIQGRSGSVRQGATVAGGKVLAHLTIESRGNQLMTSVQIAPGQTMILGQSGKYPEGAEPKGEDIPTLYYVIRAAISNARP